MNGELQRAHDQILQELTALRTEITEWVRPDSHSVGKVDGLRRAAEIIADVGLQESTAGRREARVLTAVVEDFHAVVLSGWPRYGFRNYQAACEWVNAENARRLAAGVIDGYWEKTGEGTERRISTRT